MSLKQNYLPCILVGLILLFAIGWQEPTYLVTNVEGVEGSVLAAQYQFLQTYILGPTQVVWEYFRTMLGGLFVIAYWVLQICVFNPLQVGASAFFVENRTSQVSVSRLFFIFKDPGYRNVVLILFIRYIKIYLWSLLFVIPGIVKAQEYRMIPFILAENPQMESREVFRISREMMYGHKWNAFILGLSFLPWEIISTITFGLAGILFVNPYERASEAELYAVLANRYWSQNQASDMSWG